MDIPKQNFIEGYLSKSQSVFQALAADQTLHQIIFRFSEAIAFSFSRGGRIFIAGNGGSAADAQHMAAEFVSRMGFDHEPLPAIALTADMSVLTAVANDYGFEKVFERQILALSRAEDVFLGISTSGKSANVLHALQTARKKGLVTLGLTGAATVPMDDLCDHIFHAPAHETPLVQQIHIMAIHLICGLVEDRIFGGSGHGNTAP